MAHDLSALRRIIADEDRLLTGADIPAEYQSDVLGRVHGSAEALAFPLSTEEVSALLRSLALQNGALDFIELSDARQCADIWRVRGALVKAVEAVSEQEPVDIVVPISRTADFIRFINELEAQSGMQMVSFGHAGDGNVHLCVVRGERDDETWQRELHANMDKAYAEAYRLGGVASGEHGIGVSKRPYFLRQTAKENLQAMNAVKSALDPLHILNNGKSGLASSEGAEHQRTDNGHVSFNLLEEISFDRNPAACLRFCNGPVFIHKVRNETKSGRKHERIFIRHLHLLHHGRRQILQADSAKKVNEDNRHAQHPQGSYDRFHIGTAPDFLDESKKCGKYCKHNESFDASEEFS